MDLLTKNHYTWPSKYPTPFDHQRVTADFFVRHKRSFCFNEIGCVDGQTEYLSETGWQRIDAYTSGKVAQFNIDTGQAEFVTPAGYIKLPCEDFIRFKTKYGIDQMLSPDHRVLYIGSTGKYAVLSAQEIYNRNRVNLKGFSGRIKATFGAPYKPGIDLSNADLRLAVAYIADGYFPNNTGTCVMRLKRKRKIRRLKQLLSKSRLLFSDRPCKPVGFRRISFIAPLKKKVFDADFWAASETQLRIILDEVAHWDGTFRKDNAVSFSSVEEASADFIQYCAAATGHVASLNRVCFNHRRDMFTVHIRKNDRPLYIKGVTHDGRKISNVSKTKKPNAYKYCFSVPSTYLILRRNGRIFVTGNTSKTLSALWASDFLMNVGAVKKVLIAAPLSTLWSVWDDEIWQNIYHRKAVVLHGPKEKRLKLLEQDVDYYIINHEGIKIIYHELAARKDIGLVIMDEGAKMRNGRTALWRAMNLYAGKHTGRGIWWMTGSPMPGGPTDCWAQAKLVNPDLVPKYFTRFREQVSYQTMLNNRPTWVPFRGWEDKCFSILQPSIRFTRDECLDLPECTVQQRRVAMAKDQEKAYSTMLRKFRVELEEGTITAVNEGVKRIKLMQLSAGAVYDGNDFVHNVSCTPKLNALTDIIEESGDKALVFVSFKHSIPLLRDHIRKKGWSVEVVYGDVGVSERRRIFNDFQNGDLQVIVAHPGCMAHGLTLTASHTIVWWAPVDSFATYEQACGRITRPGQVHRQTIIQLTCSDVERKIYTRLKSRAKMQGLLTELLKEK